MQKTIQLKNCIIVIASSAFVAFGLYHVHQMSGVTEGGIVGLNLLFFHWFGISPAVTNFVATLACYLFSWRLLGRSFILYSAIAAGSFSAAYAVIERSEPLWPMLREMPLLAALIGAVFVGVGVGLCVRAGGAMSGDDAFAMCISEIAHIKIETAYLISDLTVLALSMSYIPLSRIWYSLLTVLLSGRIIGIVQRAGKTERSRP